MKKLLLILICLIVFSGVGYAQKYSTRSGKVSFEASVPSFEEVAATNKVVSVILDTHAGKLAALTLMKGFRFKVALMEEHFNENYVASDTYPKATFKGEIQGYDKSKLTDQSLHWNILGDLTLHGKTKKIEIKDATVYLKNNVVYVKGNFEVAPADFDIKIPSLVSKKIADTISVSLDFELKQ
ncbi:hypothetical protein NBRC110019_12500 [Neptunitalea chrysea]|uniref:Lipid/polyisoprenoid-binding YceI-like domain-containing protein n=1 Tax=Neptunitalea chrysea TaxID=1647581 RepID=A0A9W6B464_9FLAO|nr:YceI family protein [Neptunitalea chrysea]GLB52211.1 hypothetical protein NBRC110019_12500 [Neptunitalea chrysea]